MARFSFSRVETFRQCPYKYQLRYVDGLEALPKTDDAANPLFIGTGMHTAIEKGVEAGIKAYYGCYPVITDQNVDEAIKIAALAPKVPLPEHCSFEYKLETEDFLGYIDLLERLPDGTYAIWDFKYSNNVEHYLQSAQLHVYKHYFELLNPTKHVSKLGFIFIPKTLIRPKKGEDITKFRARLLETLGTLKVQVKEVTPDAAKVTDYFQAVSEIKSSETFPKRQSGLCRFCDYFDYCTKGIDYMLLPKNERRVINAASRKKVWIYGAPFSGKTTIANGFPAPLFLNTDGNVNSFDAPYISISDQLNGRIPVLAWEVFKGAIEELMKYDNTYKTIVVDLIEDVYEHCRRWCYDKYGFTHESDAGYGKGYDIVRGEFLSVIKTLTTLNYNIVLISHEDLSRDLTKKSGDKITSIAPNINERVAKKLAGMVDLVCRLVADGDERTLNFKADEVVFGGGRLKTDAKQIPATYAALEELYEKQPGAKPVAPKPEPVEPEIPEAAELEKPAEPEPKPAAEERPRRRRRTRNADENMPF